MNWGILSTGVIAQNFAETVRRMGGEAKLYAVASRSRESADAFADRYDIPVRYASAGDMADDPNVDIVYIGTPHSAHAEGMKRMIKSGKPVLCEKSFTTDARQAREIFALARERNVFVMEAFWTKLCPVYREVERVLASGTIGELRAVTAQYGYTTGREARKFDPQMAGGTLLDIGVYAIGFACMMMGYEMDSVQSNLVMNGVGTDAIDAIILRKGGAVASLTCAIGTQMPTVGAVYGSKGRIEIPEFKNPQRATVYVDGEAPVVLSRPFDVNGFEYEIREAMACVAAGKTHSGIVTPEQTIAVMEIMDQVRAQNNLKFPFER